jgi:hypothetical protein
MYDPTKSVSDVPTSTGKERFGPYLGKTTTTPRPYADDPKVRYTGPDDLKRHQAQWDAADDWRKENERLRADRIARVEHEKAAKQQERDEADAAKRAAARQQLETRLKAQYLANPAATLETWEADKDTIIREHLRRETEGAEQEARREHARIYSGFF